MALIKRQKKSKLSPEFPGRQVICGTCGAPLFVDESPGGDIPPYCCLECRSTCPPTPQELEARSKRDAEHTLRVQERAKEFRERLERCQPLIWVQNAKLTPNQKREMKIRARMEQILAKPPDALTRREWNWLAEVWSFITRGSRAGRKREARYEEWLTKAARADLHGLHRPTLRELAGKNVPESRDQSASTSFKDEMDRLREAYKKAKKRRELPVPPMR